MPQQYDVVVVGGGVAGVPGRNVAHQLLADKRRGKVASSLRAPVGRVRRR